MLVQTVKLTVAACVLALIVFSLPLPCSCDTLTITEEDWAAVPRLDPVWILEMRGDSACIIENRFAEVESSPGRPLEFPIPFVRVSKKCTVKHKEGRFKGMNRGQASLGYATLTSDGMVEDPLVCWVYPSPSERLGKRVGRSPQGRIALYVRDGLTELRDADGALISTIPERVKWSLCFDIPERVFATAVEDAEWIRPGWELTKTIVLDYGGHRLYESSWTECSIGDVRMDKNPDVVWLSLESCLQQGSYLLRVKEGTMYRLNGLPRKGKRFSSDGCYVLLNEGGHFKFFDAQNPEALELIWQRVIGGPISDVVVGDAGSYVAFRSDWGSGPIRYIYVLSGKDGSPLCKLMWTKDRPTAGPLAFMGDYLFAGMGFGAFGTPWHTEFVYLYDLSDLKPDR